MPKSEARELIGRPLFLKEKPRAFERWFEDCLKCRVYNAEPFVGKLFFWDARQFPANVRFQVLLRPEDQI